MEQEVQQAITLIESCPAWSDLPVEDLASRGEVIESMKRLASMELDVLRQAVEGYLAAREQTDDGYDVAAMSRLYVLNRFVFDVPERVPLGGPRFGSFFGLPYDDEYVNELWPLSFGEEGDLALTGEFGGYFGESFLALEEFDYFWKEFGLRKKPALD